MRRNLLKDYISVGTPSQKVIMESLCKLAVECAVSMGLDKANVRVDSVSLYTALERYCRDAFGYQRITKAIDESFEKLSYGVPNDKKSELQGIKKYLLDTLHDCGIRIASPKPYTQKRMAFLLYHLTIAKPFYVTTFLDDNNGEKVTYFNAYVSIAIVNEVLLTCSHEFPPSKNILRDLTYHNLSRSAIEAIVRASVRQV